MPALMTIDARRAAAYASPLPSPVRRPIPNDPDLKPVECGPLPGATPTSSGIPPRRGDFLTLTAALDYAAQGETGLNFYSVRGELTRALPYRELRGAALALAATLAGAGLCPGERVGIVADTQPEFVVAFFACQYAGLVPAPLPLPAAFGGRDAYRAHIGRLVAESRAAALLGPPALTDWLAPLVGQAGLRLCSTVADLAQAGHPDGALPAPDPGGVAYLQFSSGSTRFPLGVVVQQAALMANAAAMLAHGLQTRAGDRAISWLPLYHDMGLVGFLLSPMAGQITVDLLATADFARRPLLWLSLIAERRCTVAYSPSFGYDLCVRRVRQAAGLSLDLSCWRVAGIGGDMIRPAVLARFAETFAPQGFDARAFLPSYGMAEATLAITFAPLGRGIETDTVDLDRLERDGVASPPAPGGRARTVVLCGVPIPEHELEIRGADGRALPDRAVGRILARGPSLMRGYDARPAETSAVLSADGWLDTGDIGYRLGGALVVTGRAKDLIIINGRNIWPQDLEWTVEQAVPEIRSGKIAAFSVEEDGREVLVLAAEARALSGQAAGAALAASIGDTLRAQHGLDGRVLLLPINTLPYTSSGKLSRSAARARYLAGTLTAASLVSA
jgi:fatty-acyl-CoA synthase